MLNVGTQAFFPAQNKHARIMFFMQDQGQRKEPLTNHLVCQLTEQSYIYTNNRRYNFARLYLSILVLLTVRLLELHSRKDEVSLKQRSVGQQRNANTKHVPPIATRRL